MRNRIELWVCYLNHVAVAAMVALDSGVDRVAFGISMLTTETELKLSLLEWIVFATFRPINIPAIQERESFLAKMLLISR